MTGIWKGSLCSVTVNGDRQFKVFKAAQSREVELVSVFCLKASVCLCWGVVCGMPTCDSQTAVSSPGHLFNDWNSARANYLFPLSSHSHVPLQASLISMGPLKLVFSLTQALHASKQFGIWFVVSLRGYMNSCKINRLWKLLTHSSQTTSSTAVLWNLALSKLSW